MPFRPWVRGVHALYALANIYRVNEETVILSPETTLRLRNHFVDVVKRLEAHQRPNGAWFGNWAESAEIKVKSDPTAFEAIAATGHHLEWIAIMPPDLRPSRRAIAKAAQLLVELLPAHDISTIANNYAPFSHAARALLLLEKMDPDEFLNSDAYQKVTPLARPVAKK